LRVPEDISVVGLDDIPMAELIVPPLTTVHIPRQELGKMAFSIVQKMLNGELPGGIESTLDTHLIVRGSTGANRSGPSSL
jgi:LacI family transcriptional regulator